MHALRVDYFWTLKAPELHLYFVGDIHAGSVACDIEQLDEDIAKIKRDKLARVVLMGDLGEFIKRSDKRFDPASIWGWLNERSDMAEAQAQWVVDRFKPVREKIVCLLSGNHEDKIRLAREHDIHQRIRIGLGVPSLGYYGMIRFSLKRVESAKDHRALDVACHHGMGAGTTDGAVLTTLHKLLAIYDADLVAMGHRHKRLHVEPEQIRFCGGAEPTTTARQRMAVCSGTYLNTFAPNVDTYSGKAGYQPTRTGCVMVRVLLPTDTHGGQDAQLRVEF